MASKISQMTQTTLHGVPSLAELKEVISGFEKFGVLDDAPVHISTHDDQREGFQVTFQTGKEL